MNAHGVLYVVTASLGMGESWYIRGIAYLGIQTCLRVMRNGTSIEYHKRMMPATY